MSNKTAEITETKDLNYKGGYVECNSCNWKHVFGDGFNGHHIATCPNCDPSISTRNQRKVIYWDENRKTLRADIGNNFYFVMSNGVNVRYAKRITRIAHGTERYLDTL